MEKVIEKKQKVTEETEKKWKKKVEKVMQRWKR